MPSIDTGVRGSAQGSLKLIRLDRSVWARATIQTQADTVCSRCLGSFRQTVTASVNEQFCFAASTDFHDFEADAGEPLLSIGDDHMLDLEEVVRQAVIVNLPLKPLCQPSCQGICPGCGTNLMSGACSREAERGDARWAPLASLLSSPAQR